MVNHPNRKQTAARLLQDRARKMVDQEVMCCLSSIVSDLAQVYGAVNRQSPIYGITEEAFDLSTPIDDYIEAAREGGALIEAYTHESGEERFRWRFEAEPSQASDNFGKGFADEEDAARDACDDLRIEPYQREIYEHWAVSSWLYHKLEERGERVGSFGNLKVWGRGATGQAICIDSVIEDIVAEMLKPVPVEA